MPYQKDKQRKCPRCGKLRTEWYVHGTTGKVKTSRCAPCDREILKEQRDARRAKQQPRKRAATKQRKVRAAAKS